MGFLDDARAGADAFLNPGMSAAPQTADPCEPLKEESDKILEMPDGPEKSAAISAGLQMIASQDCEEQLGYYELVDEFCSRDSHFVGMQIGHGETCMDKDIHGDQAAIWCMRKDIDEDTGIENDYPRMKTRTDVCNERGLKSRWHSTNAKYCNLYPEDDWCRCYNVKENKKYVMLSMKKVIQKSMDQNLNRQLDVIYLTPLKRTKCFIKMVTRFIRIICIAHEIHVPDLRFNIFPRVL